MLTTDTMQDALEAYRTATSLLLREQYREAIPLLVRAADAFRRNSAEGLPTEHTLENGVTSLANALYHLGVCYARSGNISQAITSLETARINEQFERSAPFRAFLQDLGPVLISCYERQIEETGPKDLSALLGNEQDIDSTCRFPFSLPPDAIPYARLYELAPQRYQRFRQFYESAKTIDSTIKIAGSKTDETTMNKISIGVWIVIATVWIVYGIVVTRTLIHTH